MSYLVSITFDSSKLDKKDVLGHVLKHTKQDRIVELEKHNLKLCVTLPPEEGLGELENILYYMLDGGELGTCTSYSKL